MAKRKSNQRIGTYPNEAETLILNGFTPASGKKAPMGQPKVGQSKKIGTALVGWGLTAVAALAAGVAYINNTTGLF